MSTQAEANAELLEELLSDVGDVEKGSEVIGEILQTAGTVENLSDFAGNIDEAIGAASAVLKELKALRARIKPVHLK